MIIIVIIIITIVITITIIVSIKGAYYKMETIFMNTEDSKTTQIYIGFDR